MKKLLLLAIPLLLVFFLAEGFSQSVPPTNVSAVVMVSGTTDFYVKVNWMHSVSGMHFNVYRKLGSVSDTGSYVKIFNNVHSTYVNDHNVLNNRIYSYYVKAYSNGQESQASDTVQVNVVWVNPENVTVTGIVLKDSVLTPLSGVMVKFIPLTGHYKTYFTDDQGKFTARLLPGKYRIYTAKLGFISEYFNNKTTFQTADTLTFAVNDSTGINIGLAVYVPLVPNVKVTAFVTNDSANTPLVNAMVKFFPLNAGHHICGHVFYTNSTGIVTANLLAGNYYVYTCKQGFVGEYYNNKVNIQTADTLILTANDSVGINIGLGIYVPPPMYNITGTVKDSVNNPLRAKLYAYKVRGGNVHHYSGYTTNDSLGNYTLMVRGGDTVIVYAAPLNFDYISEYWNNKRTLLEADRIFIGGNVSDINFVLEHKIVYNNGISGVVKDTTNTVGIRSKIIAYGYGNNSVPSGSANKCYTIMSDSLGNYVFNNMLPGKYKLLGKPFGDFRPTYFRYDGAQTLNWLMADSVVVSASGIVTGINFQVRELPEMGIALINGSVRTSANVPINGSVVYAIDENNEIVNFAVSDIYGNYKMEGMIPGTYQILVDKFSYVGGNNYNVAVDYSGNMYRTLNFTLNPDIVTGVTTETGSVSNYALSQNYPNPFNPVTVIRYSIKANSFATLKVYNILGKEVRTLVNSELNTGNYETTFDATDIPSGIYFYTLTAGDYKETKRMTLIK